MADLVTPYATLSFPQLFVAKAGFDGGPAAYSCSLLFDESAQRTKEYKAMVAAVDELVREKFPKAPKSSLRLPFRDAGEKADQYAGYDEGVTFINVKSKNKPGIVDARLQDVLTADEVYAGQIVRARISPYAYDRNGNKGVAFGLVHLQIVKSDAPRIDGRVTANKSFDAIGDEAPPF